VISVMDLAIQSKTSWFWCARKITRESGWDKN